jgi:hypothetical protein
MTFQRFQIIVVGLRWCIFKQSLIEFPNLGLESVSTTLDPIEIIIIARRRCMGILSVTASAGLGREISFGNLRRDTRGSIFDAKG